jgi:hypothetical protein
MARFVREREHAFGADFSRVRFAFAYVPFMIADLISVNFLIAPSRVETSSEPRSA